MWAGRHHNCLSRTDGRQDILNEEFEKEVKIAPGPRERAAILAQREAVIRAVDRVSGVKEVQTMDVFCQCFKAVGV